MIKRRINESMSDPSEILASLVDMGSVAIEDAFVACLNEMSDAECKRVLSKCGAGFESPDEFPADAEDGLEAPEDLDDFDAAEADEEALDDIDLEEDEEPAEDEETEEETEEEVNSELEARIRRLERRLCRR